jgi:hypothetical protein
VAETTAKKPDPWWEDESLATTFLGQLESRRSGIDAFSVGTAVDELRVPEPSAENGAKP